MGLFEAPLAGADRAGKRAAHVSEELGLEQRLGDGAAVQRHEPMAAAGAVVMNGPRDNFLARAGLAGDRESCCCRARHRLEQLKQRLHRPAASEDAAELIALLELRPQVRVLGRQPPLLERLLEHVHQLVELKRLGDEIRRAALDRVNGVLHRAIAGDHDGDDARVALDRRLDDLCPVDARQAEVGDEDVERKLIEQFEGFFAAVGLDHLETALRQPLRHERPQRRLHRRRRAGEGCLPPRCQYLDTP